MLSEEAPARYGWGFFAFWGEAGEGAILKAMGFGYSRGGGATVADEDPHLT